MIKSKMKVNVLSLFVILLFATSVFAADYLAQAEAAFLKGDASRGKQLIASYLSGSDTGETYEKVGAMFARLKKWDESVHYLEIAKNREPQVSTHYYKLGIAYHQAKKPDESVEHFRKALSINSKSIPVILALGDTLEFSGDRYDARQLYTDAVKRKVEDTELYRKLCYLNFYESFWPATINYCTKAIRRNKKDAASAAVLATAYYAAQERNRAFEIFKSAFKYQPDNNLLRRARGLIYFSEKSYEQAAQELGRAAVLNPRDDESMIYLARSLYELGRFEEARVAYFYASKMDIGYRFEFLSKQKDLMKKNRAAMAAEYQQTLEKL